MSPVNKWYEVICDDCSCAIDYYPIGNYGGWKKQTRDAGAIVTADGKSFCGKSCYDNYKAKDPFPGVPAPPKSVTKHKE